MSSRRPPPQRSLSRPRVETPASSQFDDPGDAEQGVGTLVKRDNPVAYARMEIVMPRLRFLVERESGQSRPRTLVHDGELCRIGSHPSNDLVLDDPSVSRFHCRIVREVDGFRLLDTGSKNGTRMDGVKLRDAELPPSATLKLGDSVVRVVATEKGDGVSLPVVPSFGALVGESVAMRKMFALLERIAASEIDVLIEGESGTGKELVASEIMRRGVRNGRPYIVVDCGAMSPTLVESELFGHVRGAFTGAERDRVGAFEAADGGTVFLDEIGELPLELQPKLLRALEAREVRRLGETRARKIDVRVLSATHRDLDREVNKGRFREDLYFRIAKVCVHVPALRERVMDLPLLVQSFLVLIGRPEAQELFSSAVIAEMEKHDWPGNVRELRNYVERSVVLRAIGPASRNPPSTEEATSKLVVDSAVPFRIAKESAVEAFERAYIGPLLERCSGNLSKAARLAGMDRMYLHQLAQKHGFRGGPKN
jgi:DNA-binding NtrC family response regulator